MPDSSTHLDLPYLAPAQAQKHVTHNEALQTLDAVVQLAVVDRTQTVPPGDPDTGARHIVADTATGAWAGQDGRVALWTGNAWMFIDPQTGWRAWVGDENIEVVFYNGVWQGMPIPEIPLDNVGGVGINAASDVANRLSVSANATLLTHEGAGHQLKINKASAADTASLLFQTGFSGRAEMGLAGNDAFSLKVSADGSNWTDAFSLDPVSGHASGAAVQTGVDDATPGRLMRTGAFGLGCDTLPGTASNDLDNAVATGWYDVNTTTLHSPLGGQAGICLAQSRSAQRTVQIVFRVDGGTEPGLYIRQTHGGTVWGVWRPLTPERGSNANGEYIRLCDGTQMCWRNGVIVGGQNALMTQTVQGLSHYLSPGTLSWTFPAMFSAAPVVSGGCSFRDTGWDALQITQFLAATTSAASYRHSGWAKATDGNIEFSHMAIGRWF